MKNVDDTNDGTVIVKATKTGNMKSETNNEKTKNKSNKERIINCYGNYEKNNDNHS